MADIELINQATAAGTYNSLPTALESLAITTQLVGGLVIVKTADKQVWTDGVLTYTITITNDAEHDYETTVLTDTLDITKISLVENSVKINDVATTNYTYDELTGELIVTVGTVEQDNEAVVSFQVQKV